MYIADGDDYQKRMLKEYAADWTKYGNIDFVFYDEMPKEGVHYKVSVNKSINVLRDSGSNEPLGAVFFASRDPIKSKNASEALMIEPLRFYYSDPKLPKTELTTSDSSPFLARKTVLHEFGHLLSLAHEMSNAHFPHDLREGIHESHKEQSGVVDEVHYTHEKFDPYSVMGYMHVKGLWPLPFLSLQDKLWIARTYPGRMSEEEIRKEHVKDIKKFSNNGYCKIYEPNSVDNKKFSCKDKFGIGLVKENWIYKELNCYDTIEKAISVLMKYSEADKSCGPYSDITPDNFEAENKLRNESPDCPPEGVQDATTNELMKDVSKIVKQIPKPETY